MLKLEEINTKKKSILRFLFCFMGSRWKLNVQKRHNECNGIGLQLYRPEYQKNKCVQCVFLLWFSNCGMYNLIYICHVFKLVFFWL